jgi:L-galactose dehydrogenase
MGFGCAPLGDEYGATRDDEAERIVREAIDAGINIFDTSPYYGRTLSESRLGAALEGRRGEVVLATKGGRFDAALETGFDFSTANIIAMCEASLRRLRTDYLDIYQLHDIEFAPGNIIFEEAIPALYKLREQGKVRWIGVTGYPLRLLKSVIEAAELDVTLSYCHYDLMNDRLSEILVPVVKARHMGLINGSVTHMGILTEPGPPEWHPAPEEVKAAGRAAAAYCRDRGRSLPQLAIQYALANPDVNVTLLGVRTVSELEASVELVEKPIDAELLAAVRQIIAPVVNRSWPSGQPEHYENESIESPGSGTRVAPIRAARGSRERSPDLPRRR